MHTIMYRKPSNVSPTKHTHGLFHRHSMPHRHSPTMPLYPYLHSVVQTSMARRAVLSTLKESFLSES